jgi:hypothetical protein
MLRRQTVGLVLIMIALLVFVLARFHAWSVWRQF